MSPQCVEGLKGSCSRGVADGVTMAGVVLMVLINLVVTLWPEWTLRFRKWNQRRRDLRKLQRERWEREEALRISNASPYRGAHAGTFSLPLAPRRLIVADLVLLSIMLAVIGVFHVFAP